MDVFLYFLKNVVIYALGALELAMFLRVILSWIPIGDGRFEDFLFMITEPFIEPVRCVIDKFDSLRNLPIDIAFFITFMLVSVVGSVLSMFM